MVGRDQRHSRTRNFGAVSLSKERPVETLALRLLLEAASADPARPLGRHRRVLPVVAC